MLLSRLRNRVEFWKQEKIRQPSGSLETVWSRQFDAWAEVISIGGEEGRLAAANSSSVRYRLTMRYRRDLDPSMIVKNLDDGRFLPVKAIRDPDGRKNIVELTCEWKQGQTEPS